MAHHIKTLNRAVELGADRSLFERTVTTYRNGDRGIHHLSLSCDKLNSTAPLTTTTDLLSLPDRVCGTCFDEALSVDMRTTCGFLRQVISTVNVIDRHIRDLDTTKMRRTTSTLGELEMLVEDLESTVAEATERAGTGFAATLRNRISTIRTISTSNSDPLRASVTRTAAAKLMSREHGTGSRAPFVTDEDDTLLGMMPDNDDKQTLVTTVVYRRWLRHVYEHGDYDLAREAVRILVADSRATMIEQLNGLDPTTLATASDIVTALQHAWKLQRDITVERLVQQWTTTHQRMLADPSYAIVGIGQAWTPEDFAATIAAVYRPVRHGDHTLIVVPAVVARWLTQNGNGIRNAFVSDPASTAGRDLEDLHEIAETAVTLWASAVRANATTLDDAVTTATLL